MTLKVSDFTKKKKISSRAASTVDNLLLATARLLEKDALHEISTNHVAQVAGYSIGTLYKYFPDKNAIFHALAIREISNRLEKSLFEINNISGESLYYYIDFLFTYLKNKNNENIGLSLKFLLYSKKDESLAKKIIDYQDSYVEKLFRIIENKAVDVNIIIDNNKIKIFSSLLFSFIRKYIILKNNDISDLEQIQFVKTLVFIIKS